MIVLTDFSVAYSSHDHIEPKGTANDNTHCLPFVERAEELAGDQKIVMADLGCAGGGLVKDFLDRGHRAVGIEGSDFSQKNQRAEWATIPDSLFTADITKPFVIINNDGSHALCDLITSWDVLEHIHREDLGVLICNIRNNLKMGGLFVCSIATFPDGDWHVTLEPEEWWVERFEKYGLRKIESPFEQGHMVRQSSFYLTLQKV
jgi:predicted TPR repeat methyltransferase